MSAAAPEQVKTLANDGPAVPAVTDKPLNGPEGSADNEDDDEEDEEGDGAAPVTGEKKKKKKKKSKKKKAGTSTAIAMTSSQALAQQCSPPRTPVSHFFKNGQYPIGEEFEYIGSQSYRTTSEEKRHLERIAMQEDLTSPNNYNSIRKAAEVHRQVRRYARDNIKPGMGMTEIANLIEDGTRALVEAKGFESGIGFPTGLSRNHCAAHYTPNAGDNIVLKHEDVLKVDIGVHVNGRICDSAFTLNWEPTYDNLLKAVQDATNTGVKEAGIDVRTADIGAAIQEVMESYEVEVNGKVKQVKSIRNLTGHNIAPYLIHAGKSVPIAKATREDDFSEKMEEGEYFAIETFGSTGNGWVEHDGPCSHYARKGDAPGVPATAAERKLLAHINKEFGTLPWCRRYLDRTGETAYLRNLNNLVKQDLIMDYPPLSDIPGSMTAQFEHSIILRPTCKEVVSRGDDY